MDGITAEMLKNGGEATTDWMQITCNLIWKRRRLDRGAFVLIYEENKNE